MKKNKKNSGIRAFQGGAQFVDEDELFDDGDSSVRVGGQLAKGDLDGELVQGDDDDGNLEDDAEDIEAAEDDAPEGTQEEEDEEEVDEDASDVELTGVETFLTTYGINGGIITYEDGTSARFSELDAVEQNNILSSLISDSVPTIEEKYNLDEDEISLLNAVRDSSMSSEEFINSIVDTRLQTVLASRDASTTDYSKLSQDAIFVKNLKDNEPGITEQSIAEELVKAKELSSYKSTVETMRKLYINEQDEEVTAAAAERNRLFNQEIEAQRYDIVAAIEGINDVAGASISTDMKEYLLRDIMELNESKDPILMEKIFSDPKTMFEANWFINYGKDYMAQLNNYWKKEVSKAQRRGYDQAAGKLPSNPTIIGEGRKKSAGVTVDDDALPGGFGKIISEEDLFKE